MRILLTRPREDSERLARKLEALGHEVLIEPLLTIEPDLGSPLDLDGVQAVLFTSANGARAFALRSARRDLRVFAVGDATAAAAREFGFTQVESADGDVGDLARLVRERLKPGDGPVLHAAGSVTAGDLPGMLEADGFEVRRAVLYRAEPVTALSDDTVAALRAGRVDMVVFFSPRTAKTFASLAAAADLRAACARIVMLGLSPAVVAAAAELPWLAREAAARPNEAALIEAIQRREGAMADAATQEGNGKTPEPAQAASGPSANVPAATAGRQGSGWRVVSGLALLLAIAALAWTAWRDLNPASDPAAERLAQQEQRLATIERDASTRMAALERDLSQRLATLEQGRGDVDRRLEVLAERASTIETRIAEVVRTVEGLTERLRQLEEAPQVQADPARLASMTAENRRLAQELARLQEEFAALNASINERAELRRNESLSLALGQLREAIERGRPYAAELATLRAIAGDDAGLTPAIAYLEPGAAAGVPGRTILRARFEAVAKDVIRAARTGGDDSWWRQLLDRLTSLVTIRRIGEVDGDTPEAVVARAERRLAADDLAGAVAELERLQGEPAAAAGSWLADARTRLAAEAALAGLAAHVLRTGSDAP